FFHFFVISLEFAHASELGLGIEDVEISHVLLAISSKTAGCAKIANDFAGYLIDKLNFGAAFSK
ncbi:MAG: hypothetical protein J7639_17690, partial [Paenibacillaceae bacterium]|nr:hypothetical protein [Paenibacillaceae bacterium]